MNGVVNSFSLHISNLLKALMSWQTLLFIFLFPLFFVLHGYNESFGLIPLAIIFQLFIKYSAISALVFLLSFLFFKNGHKAILFSFCLLCVYFFFGAAYDFLKQYLRSSFFTSYTFLLSFLFLGFAGIAFLLKKKKKEVFTQSIRYISTLILLLFVWEVGSLSVKYFFNEVKRNDLSVKTTELNSSNVAIQDSTLPDIFFVLFDGYTSSKCLKEEFLFDNSFLDSTLKANHFYIATNSVSNYNYTFFSLSSTFSLNYVEPHHKTITSKDLLQGLETFRNNQLVSFLGNTGYQIKNLGCLDMNEAPLHTVPYFDQMNYNQIDGQTLSGRIKRNIWWNFVLRDLLTGEFVVPDGYMKSKEYHLYRNEYNWNSLLKEMGEGSTKPRMVYTHLMLPHEPFYLAADGSFVSDTAILKGKLNLKHSYIGQVQYANKLISQLMALVEKNTGRKKIVIIQGDHGFRNYEKGVPHQKEFMNLNAVYFSDHEYGLLYDTISSVNTFRVVLNKYFGKKMSMLKDTSFYYTNKIEM